jgi:hypothetical protein
MMKIYQAFLTCYIQNCIDDVSADLLLLGEVPVRPSYPPLPTSEPLSLIRGRWNSEELQPNILNEFIVCSWVEGSGMMFIHRQD